METFYIVPTNRPFAACEAFEATPAEARRAAALAGADPKPGDGPTGLVYLERDGRVHVVANYDADGRVFTGLSRGTEPGDDPTVEWLRITESSLGRVA